MAPIEPERVLERVEPFPLGLVAAVGQPAPCLQEYRGSEEAIAFPPVARASRSAAETKNALVVAVELAALLWRLQPFLLRLRRPGLKPGLDRCILGEDVCRAGNGVLDDPHIGQRVDGCLRPHVRNESRASEPVAAVQVHGARTADPLPTRAAEEQCIENHRSAVIDVNMKRIETRIAAGVGIVTVDLDLRQQLKTREWCQSRTVRRSASSQARTGYADIFEIYGEHEAVMDYSQVLIEGNQTGCSRTAVAMQTPLGRYRCAVGRISCAERGRGRPREICRWLRAG